MGNCTITVKKGAPGITPAGQAKIVDIALSSSYATGGDTVPLASLGFKDCNALSLCGAALSPAGHAIEVIYGAAGVAPLLRIRDAATGAEIANATNLSAQSIRAIAYGDNPHV